MDRILDASEVTDDQDDCGNGANFKRSLGDAACFGGMVGCGETYFPAFALAVGLGETAAGLIASLPLLVGGTIQLVSPHAIRWMGSLRRWIVIGATVQAIAFVPLAFAAWNQTVTLPVFLVIASIYWAAGLSTGPAWNTWIEHIVPPPYRASFFSRRSRLQQICTFAALMLAGVILHVTSSYGIALLGFSALFFSAFVLRLLSAGFLHRTRRPAIDEVVSEIKPVEKKEAMVQSQPTDRSAIRLLAYLVAMQLFIQLSSPYFVPYMLEELEMGYGSYVSLIAIAFLSKVASLTLWGRVAEKSGAKKVLWCGGIGLVPLSALWIVSTNFYWLFAIQVLSGIAWAAYELGFFLMFFEMLPANQRTRMLTNYNFANTLAICIGALTGGIILWQWGGHPQTYFALFGLSSLGRLLCLGLLVGIVLPTGGLRKIRLRFLSIRAGAGSVSAPVIASAEES